MFPGVGTVINLIAILIGASSGVFIGAKMPLRTRILITDVLGLTTLLGGAGALTRLWGHDYVSALPKGWTLLAILLSLILGGFLGSIARLEDRLESMGEGLRKRFRASSQGNFVEGFVSASLLFAIGPLAILGSVSDGMSTGIDQLLLKSSLDFFAAMAFAASLGWGVAASVIPVGIYQAVWTVIGVVLGSVLTTYQVDAMTIVGGVLLICIGLKLLKIKDVGAGNLLPALVFAPLIAWGLHSFVS
jgi:hypothetical protein